jgi:hypothetical protein
MGSSWMPADLGLTASPPAGVARAWLRAAATLRSSAVQGIRPERERRFEGRRRPSFLEPAHRHSIRRAGYVVDGIVGRHGFHRRGKLDTNDALASGTVCPRLCTPNGAIT